jgi:hypothetical protein
MQGSKLKGALKSSHALNLKHVIEFIKTIKTFISLTFDKITSDIL